MTDYDMRCGVKSSREYVRSAVTGASLKSSIPMIICAALLTALPIAGIIGYFMINDPLMLVVTGAALIIGVCVVIILTVVINNTAAKLMEAYSKQDGLVCSVSDERIIISRDGKPQRVLGWDSITEMFEGKHAFFLKAGENGLMILDKDKMLSGSLQETSELFAKKSGEEK